MNMEFCPVCGKPFNGIRHNFELDNSKDLKALSKLNPLIITEVGDRFSICNDCHSKLFYYCDRCSERVHKHELCKCIQNKVLSYGNKTTVFPIYNGIVKYPKLRLGLEIETLFHGKMDREEALTEFTKVIGPSLCKFKYDNSLGPNGIEFVTMPMYFEHFKEMSKKWDKAFKVYGRLGGHSFNDYRTGCHIHISRNAFVGYKHLYNFYIGITKNPRFTFRIAKRAENRFCATPAYRMGCRFNGIENYAYTAIRSEYGSRYQMINLENKDTIEVRVYKGNIKWSSVMGYIEHVYSMFEYSLLITNQKKEFTVEEYRQFVITNRDRYPELVKVI